jgi:hypothetical protein
VRVAVTVAPVPAVLSVIPDTTTELLPERIVPVTVPPMLPAAPLLLNVKSVLANTLAGRSLLSTEVIVALKPEPAVAGLGVMLVTVNFTGGLKAISPRSLPRPRVCSVVRLLLFDRIAGREGRGGLAGRYFHPVAAVVQADIRLCARVEGGRIMLFASIVGG